VWEQYDQSVGADTLQRPGGDAAVVRVHGSKKALATTTDCTPRYCYADPVEGGKQAVAEAYRNLCAVGAKPLAITNCLNFGNPQRPEIMGQFVGCVEGMAEACRALDFPVVSGNVSLYNETKNDDGTSLAILPSPAIGGVGLLQDWESSASTGFKAAGESIVLVGPNVEGFGDGHLGQSLWLREICGRSEGLPPRVDLAEERRSGEFVQKAIAGALVSAVHDVSDGGILVAIAEMALTGNLGAEVDCLSSDAAQFWFGENQARFVLSISDDNAFWRLVREFEIGVATLGKVINSPELRIGRSRALGEDSMSLTDLRAAHEGFFPKLMGSELTPEF
jgi:phosphoribosylformylglycinamidine synthase